MKRLLLIFSILISCTLLKAQEFVVDSFELLPEDNEARQNKVYDTNDVLCALIKVYVSNLPDLDFNSSYIIDKSDSKYNEGYYNVYVSKGIRSLDIKHGDYIPLKVNFKDFDVRLESGKVYALRLHTEGQKLKPTQTVVFQVMPNTATITIDGETFPLEKGTLQKEFLPGKYHYTISSECYNPLEGDLVVTDISQAQTVSEKLNPIMCDVEIQVLNNVKNAELIVDNRKKGAPGKLSLPMGWRNIRISADNWKEYKKKEWIEPGKKIQVTLEPKPVFPVVIRSGTGFKNPKLFINQKEVEGWKDDGKPVMVKRGKQHVMIVEQVEAVGSSSGVKYNKDGRSKSKFITFEPDMEPVTIY